ncbi:MAG: GNAT family N-acetyltransferase [Acidimicrobiales bacterium]
MGDVDRAPNQVVETVSAREGDAGVRLGGQDGFKVVRREDRAMGSGVSFRRASLADLDAVIELLADDHHQLIVGHEGDTIVAVLQLTVLPCLTHGGRRRAQIEGVRVATDRRGTGVGKGLLAFTLARARDAGCGVAQLTTDRDRPVAASFYESLGFKPTHVGMKLDLTRP